MKRIRQLLTIVAQRLIAKVRSGHESIKASGTHKIRPIFVDGEARRKRPVGFRLRYVEKRNLHLLVHFYAIIARSRRVVGQLVFFKALKRPRNRAYFYAGAPAVDMQATFVHTSKRVNTGKYRG